MTTKLGHFEIIEEIGSGGIGKVYRAFDPSLNRQVAIKILAPELAQDPEFVESFLREAQSAAAISHPHIAQVHLVGEDNGQYYIAMEMLEGCTLSKLVEEAGPVEEERVLRIAIEATEALRAAYDRKMIHGDIKPANILLTESSGLKLVDFGLAKLANIEATETDSIWGSAFFISPERIQRQPEDFRSDIYSLGATLFEALTGRPPFDAETVDEVLSMHLHTPAPSVLEKNPAITERTAKIIAKMLGKTPLLRYTDYSFLLRDLHDAEAAMAAVASLVQDLRRTTLLQVPARVETPSKSSPVVLISSLAAVALALAAFGFVIFQKKQGPAPGITAAPSAAAASATSGTAAGKSPIPDPKTVTFHYENPSAKSVLIAGSFNNWIPEKMPRETRGWTIQKDVVRGKTVEYQFIVDGKAIADPARGHGKPDGKGGEKTAYWIEPRGFQKSKHEASNGE